MASAVLPEIKADSEGIKFAHKSEKLFSQLLEAHGIPTEYEPMTFPLKNGNGEEVGFKPDLYFHLLGADVYIELTRSPKSKHRTLKYRKIKLLEEQHPGIHIFCGIYAYQPDRVKLYYGYRGPDGIEGGSPHIFILDKHFPQLLEYVKEKIAENSPGQIRTAVSGSKDPNA